MNNEPISKILDEIDEEHRKDNDDFNAFRGKFVKTLWDAIDTGTLCLIDLPKKYHHYYNFLVDFLKDNPLVTTIKCKPEFLNWASRLQYSKVYTVTHIELEYEREGCYA